MTLVDPARRFLAGAVAFALVAVTPVTAEDPVTHEDKGTARAAEDAKGVLAGHSYHGEVFNEGPRQKAYLMTGTGKVHLEVSTEVPDAQAFFNQGVGQLHGHSPAESRPSMPRAEAFPPSARATAVTLWSIMPG